VVVLMVVSATIASMTTMSDGSVVDGVTTTVKLERELWLRVKVLAARENKSASRWVREAVRLVADKTEARDA